MAVSAPPDPQSSPARRFHLLRAFSLPLPLPLSSLPSRTPTPANDSSAAATADGVELDLLEPPQSQHQQQPPSLRRRQTTATTNTEDITTTRLPWPVQAVGLASPTRHRRSLESCFSDASSLSTLSESEPRRTPSRPRLPKTKTREAESEAIWREHWF